jgi:outer membrane protein insertion porin family
MKESHSISISILSISLLFLFFGVTTLSAKDSSARNEEFTFKRALVKSVNLDGVRSFSQSDIKGLLLTKPNHWYNFLKKRRLSRSVVIEDAGTIVRFYKRRGYLDPIINYEIVREPSNKATVIFYVHEGLRTYLSGVQIEGGLDSVNQKFNKTLRTLDINEPINAEKMLAGGFKLRDIYFDNGYPYCKIASKYNFNDDTTRASLVYNVAESLFTIEGTTKVISNAFTRQNVILRELVTKPGRMFKQQDVFDSEQRLYATGLFKFVSLRRDDSTAIVTGDTAYTDFKLSLSERKPFYTNLGVGIGREPNFDLVQRNSVQFGDRNIMGTGRNLSISIKPYFQIADAQGNLSTLHLSDLTKKLKFTLISSAAELNYLEPWFLGYRIPAIGKFSYAPYALNPILSYRYDQTLGQAIFSRKIGSFSTMRLTASIYYTHIRNVPPDQSEAYREEGNNQTHHSLQFYGERDTRDNIFIPQQGSYSFGGVDYSGHILGGDFDFFKLQVSTSRYQILTGQNILATRIWLGWLNDRDGRSTLSDRFIIGGASTIRGYTENSLGPRFALSDSIGTAFLNKPKGGRFLLVSNFEIRRPLFWRFGGSAFLDAGNTWWEFADIRPLTLAFTTGLGLEFFTPIGPIRFDYGVRLKKRFDLSNGLYDLAILYAF